MAGAHISELWSSAPRRHCNKLHHLLNTNDPFPIKADFSSTSPPFPGDHAARQRACAFGVSRCDKRTALAHCTDKNSNAIGLFVAPMLSMMKQPNFPQAP
jgi:hypothetical protein